MVAFRLRFKPGYIFLANGHVAKLTSDLAKAHPPYSSKKYMILAGAIYYICGSQVGYVIIPRKCKN